MVVAVCGSIRPVAAAASSPRLGHRLASASSLRPRTQRRCVSDGPVIFSGIQPTGVPHLGNYLGAMRQWQRLQDHAPDHARLLFSIVDLHAITMPQDPVVMRTRKREMLASLVAIGLDPQRSTMFYQSSVPAHSELMWILSCTASFGYLKRMTQWKSKLQQGNNSDSLDEDTISATLKLGLFSYPVLQAADILVHRATHVPVGDDQKQHLEFARECVTNFNNTYQSQALVAPETITSPMPRIMSLVNPLNKMSKSVPNHRSRILITSTDQEIHQRCMGAVTDSLNEVTYEPNRRPGVANLLEIGAQCRSEEISPQELADELRGASLGDLKKLVSEAVTGALSGVRERYEEVLHRKGGKWLDEVEAAGAEVANANARETMRAVKDAVGLSGP